MKHNRFSRREFLSKKIKCSCNGESKLVKRRNFPHGKNSVSRSYSVYKCSDCKKETPVGKHQSSRNKF